MSSKNSEALTTSRQTGNLRATFLQYKKDLRHPALTGQIHSDPKSKNHDFDPDNEILSLEGQELAQ